MAERYPVAYVRRSAADATDTGDVSREAQESTVRALAHRDGHNGDLVIFTDWSKSASEEKSSKRTQYAAMVARIEAGEVSDVYAYSLDRLNRSLILAARFARACEDNGVRIVTGREGEVRQDSPAEWLRWTILATFGEYELRTIKARAATARRVREERGDHIGRVGYGFKLERDAAGVIVAVPDPDRPLEPVLQAVREAPSILAACKLLNARGVPVPQGPSAERRHGSTQWYPTPLRKIVERNAPELLPPVGPTRRHQPTNALLAQLLVCHCGHVLTPQGRRRWGQPAYRCTVANRTGRETHGPGWTTEAVLLPWIKAEAARFRVPADAHEIDVANDDARQRLDAKRARIVESYIEGLFDKAERDRRLASIDADLERLPVHRSGHQEIPQSIDWDAWPPAAINAVLRTYWNAIILGPDLLPVRADWKLPAEYWA